MARKRRKPGAVSGSDRANDRAPWVLGLSVVYTLSGFCALIYQTIWIHKFSLVFGSTIFASSVVISVFFAGMALGNVIFGRMSVGSKNPVWLFSVLQIGIGLYAFAFPLLLGVSEKFYAAAYPFAAAGLIQATLVRMALAMLVLILPTILMGGTFPLLVRHLVRHLQEVGGRAGLLYGVNALGGAAGAVISGFFFLRYLGDSSTNLLAGVLSLAAGLASLAFSRDTRLKTVESPKAVPQKQVEQDATSKPVLIVTMGCFALTGLVSMAYEIYWLRYLALLIQDTIYLYTGIIAVFVLGIGLGSVLMGSTASRTRWPVAMFGLIELGTGVGTAIAVYASALAFEPISRTVRGHGALLLLLLVGLLFIPALLMGAKFPVVARIVAPNVNDVGNRVGKANALNTLGAVLGLLLGGFCFFPLFGLQGTLFVLFAGSMLSATLLIGADSRFRRRGLALLPLGLALLLPMISSLILGGRLPDCLLAKDFARGREELVDVREGLVSTTSVARSPDHGFVLYDNRIVIGEGQRGNFATGGYIPVLIMREPPRRVLSLAFGAGVSSHAARSLESLEKITCVDISRENIEASLDYFPENADLRHDRRAEFAIDDAYNFVKYSKDSYDLILVEPTPPMYSFRCASLYTKEFYAYAAERLTPNGLFAQVLPLGNLSSAEARSVMKTFASVFAECLLWYNGRDCVMIGSNQKIELDVEEIVGRLKTPRIQEVLARHSHHKFNLSANFISGLLLATDEFRQVAEEGAVYTDDRSALRYSTGKEDSLALVEQIHANLTPWDKLQSEVFVFQQFGKNLSKLVGLREMLMLGLYRGDARCRKMLHYIDKFSSQKAEDYQSLIDELRVKKELSFVEKKTLKNAISRLEQLRQDESDKRN